LTRALRALASISLLVVVAAACARPGSSAAGSTTPLDLYGANPSLADVQSLLGDSNWWPGPPSFGVRPLDSTSLPFAQKFHVTTRFAHIGTAETLDIEYALWNSTTSATTALTNIQTVFGTSTAGTKVGDQVLYYGQRSSSGPAPFGTLTVVRIGASVTTIILSLKDAFPTVSQLGKIAVKATSRLRDVLNGKVHVSPLPTSDAAMLPPPGPDLTLLGSMKLPVEAFVVMSGTAAPDALAGILHAAGADTIVFGDYALDNDTRMEVRAGLFNFPSSQQASGWVDALRGSSIPDQQGIATFYDNGSGQYFSLFTAGTKAALLVCRSAVIGEAASRACESPLSRVAPAWQLSLTG
jgi:hypothetical protein